MKILFHTPTGTTKPYPRADDETPVGLDPEYQVFELIAPDPPTHDPETHYVRRAPEVIDQTTKTVTRGWEVVARETPPIVVTKHSFFLALPREDDVKLKNYVANIQDEDEKHLAKVHLTHATAVSRTHPFVLQVAAILGKTPPEMDALFAKAQAFDTAS